jgi:hypothetical protein
MVMHLTQVSTRCSIDTWRDILKLYLSLSNNLTQKRPVANIFLRSDGLMDIDVPNVSILKLGGLEGIYSNAPNADIRIQ